VGRRHRYRRGEIPLKGGELAGILVNVYWRQGNRVLSQSAKTFLELEKVFLMRAYQASEKWNLRMQRCCPFVGCFHARAGDNGDGMPAQSSLSEQQYAYKAFFGAEFGGGRLPVSWLAKLNLEITILLELYLIFTPSSTATSRSCFAVLLDPKFVTIIEVCRAHKMGGRVYG
jgi:hypothetical protein